MKKLLLSVVVLMVATLLFSHSDITEATDGVSQDNSVEIIKDAEIAS